MKPKKVAVLDSHKETLPDGKETGALVVVLGLEGTPPDQGSRYVIRPHRGSEALNIGYMVNKLITPRQLRVAELHDVAKQDPQVMKDIEELEKTNPVEADLRRKQLSSDSDPIQMMRAMGDAWRDIDPDVETNLTNQLLKYTSCPVGALSQKSVMDNWFSVDKLAHIKPLRDEVIAFNRFLDMMDGAF
jgi:hypothetical protein